MPTKVATHTSEAEGGLKRLHFCRFDRTGAPVSANYGMQKAQGTNLQDYICCAYGVAPHADMPEGVYTRMAHRLHSEVGAAGYYYCQSAEGVPFWISVSLYPTANGIVACHFEVTSPIIDKFGKFFAHLKGAERDGLNPQESGEQLIRLMVEEGIADYRRIAKDVMFEEVTKRRGAVPRAQYHSLKSLNTMWETLRLIEIQGKEIGTISERSKLIPYKLKLQAARLEGGKGPISAIAGNHQSLNGALLEITKDIQEASATETHKVMDALAYLAQSHHAAEIIETANMAGNNTWVLSDTDQSELTEVIHDCAKQVRKVLIGIDKNALTLTGITHRLRRALSAMEMTRLMCKIERAKLEGPTEGLGDIVTQLQLVERHMSSVMEQIDSAAQTALNLVEYINRDAARKVA